MFYLLTELNTITLHDLDHIEQKKRGDRSTVANWICWWILNECHDDQGGHREVPQPMKND